MKERIKEIRKYFKLTQADFAESIHVSKSTLEKYEYGSVEPAERSIDLICRVYSVSEVWLRTGDGEMFVKSPESELVDMANEALECDSKLKIDLINVILSLNDDDLLTWLKVGKEILAEVEKDLPN